jgi:hypothetical protein
MLARHTLYEDVVCVRRHFPNIKLEVVKRADDLLEAEK